MIITKEWILKYKSLVNGFTKVQLKSIGVQFPPKKGWIDRSIGKEISEENRIIFENEAERRIEKKKFIRFKVKSKRTKKDWFNMPDKKNGINNREKYKAYLKSNEWKLFRKEAFKHYGKMCNRCFRTHLTLDIHHLTYVRLYKELLIDVEVLCRDCHEKEHTKKNNNKTK